MRVLSRGYQGIALGYDLAYDVNDTILQELKSTESKDAGSPPPPPHIAAR